MQRDRATVRRSSSVSVTLGKRRGDEFPCEPWEMPAAHEACGLSIIEQLDLTELATQRQFVYSHVWRVNDLVMWDNRSTMHRGRRFDPNESRDIRQTRLAGDGPTIAQATS